MDGQDGSFGLPHIVKHFLGIINILLGILSELCESVIRALSSTTRIEDLKRETAILFWNVWSNTLYSVQSIQTDFV